MNTKTEKQYKWETKSCDLILSLSTPPQAVQAKCYGDLAIYTQYGTSCVFHMPSAMTLFHTIRAERSVKASVKRMASLFDDMPNKERPDGNSPEYKAWFAGVKDQLLAERIKMYGY